MMDSEKQKRQQSQRKREHIAIAEKFFRSTESTTNDYQAVRILHPEFPDITINEVNLETHLFNHEISAPIYINAITGGTSQATSINQKLSQLAAHFNIPMAVGSMSILKHQPDQRDDFSTVRKLNPDGFIFANLGVTSDMSFIEDMVNLISADALQIHLNAAQEFVMPEGEQDFKWSTDFKRIVKKIGNGKPVVAKEVGFGMSQDEIKRCLSLGASGVDLSGASSTNFIAIENERRSQRIISDLSGFGLSTVESLLDRLVIIQNEGRFDARTFASGGIRTPWQAIVAFSLGADQVGMSAYFLNLALHYNLSDMINEFSRWLTEFKGLLATFGCHDIEGLRELRLVLSPTLLSFVQQNGLDWSKYRLARI